MVVVATAKEALAVARAGEAKTAEEDALEAAMTAGAAGAWVVEVMAAAMVAAAGIEAGSRGCQEDSWGVEARASEARAEAGRANCRRRSPWW